MVKTRQQKSSKPKKAPQVKKQGKEADISQFRSQLDALGLKIITITADGNCFFRALADQLEGNEEEHGKYRGMVVQFIRENRETFEPFIEDDQPFDGYCQSMEKDGTWAGQLELQAASLVTRCNICIHQCMLPRWYIQNFDQSGARMVHLSYHDGEHYNSVRSEEDPCAGSARPIIIKADADLSGTTNQAKAAASKSKGAARDIMDPGSIKLVMAGSCCGDTEKVKQVLLEVNGDIDAAIEFLIADQNTDDHPAENDQTNHADTSSECQGDVEDANSEQHKEEAANKSNQRDPSSNSVKPTHKDIKSQADDKKIPRNKVCPCGSKKKYKSCCGAGKWRSSTKFAFDQIVDSRKGRKERKQGKKGEAAETTPSNGSDSGPLDLGALCI